MSSSRASTKPTASKAPARSPPHAVRAGPLDLATASLADLDDIKVKTRFVGGTKQLIVDGSDEVFFTVVTARKIYDPSKNLFDNKTVDTSKFSIVGEIPLAQCRLIQSLQTQMGSDWKPFLPAESFSPARKCLFKPLTTLRSLSLTIISKDKQTTT
jgi:hypothetical protein